LWSFQRDQQEISLLQAALIRHLRLKVLQYTDSMGLYEQAQCRQVSIHECPIYPPSSADKPNLIKAWKDFCVIQRFPVLQSHPLSATFLFPTFPFLQILHLRRILAVPNPPTPSGSELIMGNTTFSLVPPRMPAAGHGRQASVPLSTRGSEDGLMAGNGRFPSDALRYDVTSFIGGYAVGGNPPGSPLAQRGREGSVTTMQSTTGSNPKEDGGPEPIRIQTQNQSTIGSSNLQPIRESPVRRGQDLPFATAPLSNLNRTNIMGKPPVQKLDISRPLQRYSVEDAFAYERPRDAPVVIDNSGT